MNYIITGKNFTSPLLNKYKGQLNFFVLTEEELRSSNIIFSQEDKIFAPDETSFPIVLARIKDKKREQIENIKNKYNCRLLLKDIYPNFYFKSVKLVDLKFVKLPKNKKYIIKPQKGFFSVGVKEIDSNTDLKKTATELEENIKKNISFFSKEVFTEEDFIIEEYIEGNEYTFDLFYDEKGKPVIVNMCHHPMSKFKEYFNLLYYTSQDIYEKFHEQVINIFTDFNKTLNITNLPIHAEFRERDGQLIPIEFNLPRFGGWGLADLPYHAFNLESFKHFFAGTKPDWKKIFTEHKNKYYGWVLCYNGIGIDVSKYRPDYEKLKKDLGNVLHLYKLDYTTKPTFAIAYVEKTNKKELDNLLKMDFRDYFVPIKKVV
ncbi:MAG TPA: hypothetical protein DEB09_05605 [Candidatus Magasanikbacteria bacterium]|nr:hypothetical protein [Candidatus Magasanikbacteria bacterium]